MTKEELTTMEEKILFHTLGYDYEPRWNDNNGGYRNFYATTDSNVIKIIESLIDKGYMQRNKDVFNEQVFSVKDKGIVYVIDLWGKKKKQNKPKKEMEYMTKEECEIETSKAIMEMKSHIEKLEKENAELKEQIGDVIECFTSSSSGDDFEMAESAREVMEVLNMQCYRHGEVKSKLTKAKEIIKKFSEFVNNEVEYDPEHPQEHTDLWNKLCERAEEFLKEGKLF